LISPLKIIGDFSGVGVEGERLLVGSGEEEWSGVGECQRYFWIRFVPLLSSRGGCPVPVVNDIVAWMWCCWCEGEWGWGGCEEEGDGVLWRHMVFHDVTDRILEFENSNLNSNSIPFRKSNTVVFWIFGLFSFSFPRVRINF
jgi:hypothetical protein